MTVYQFYISLFKYQKKYPWLFLGVVVSSIFIALCDSAIPILVKEFFDFVSGNRFFSSYWPILALLVANFILISIAAISERYTASRLATHIVNDLRFNILKKIQSSQSNGQAIDGGQVTSVFTRSITKLQGTMIFIIWTYAYYALLLIFSAVTLLYFELHLALIIFAFIAAYYDLPRYFAKKAASYLDRVSHAEFTLVDAVHEEMRLQKVIRIFLLTDYRRTLFKKLLATTKKFTDHYEMNLGMVEISAILSTHLMRVITLSVGVVLVSTHHLTLMEFTAFYLALGNFIFAVSSISGKHTEASQGAASLAEIEALIGNMNEDAKPLAQTTLSPFSKNIVLNDVYFKYKDEFVLSNINLDIVAGQSVAFVGPSGSGKSTMLKLLLRDLSATQGTITLDGVNINDIELESFYKQIGVIYQDSLLFATTIANNISVGKLDATKDDIIAAAKAAELHDDVMNLPLGYETPLGDKNQALSGGQSQRVAIARALISSPAILFLDEATSALDPLNCEAIDRTIDKMAGKRTVISVTHRLRSAMNADQIVVMNKGEIIECGKHDALLAQHGLYYRLWEKQHGVTLSEDNTKGTFNPLWFKFVPMFATLPLDILKRISTEFDIETVDENTVLFNEGDSGDKFYVLAAGKVSVSHYNNESGQSEQIGVLTDGDFFGEIALLSNVPRNASVKTISVCIFMTLTAHRFHQLFSAFPDYIQKSLREKAIERS